MIEEKDLRALGGRWADIAITEEKAALVPDGPIMVGGEWPTDKPLAIAWVCYLCTEQVAISPKDAEVIRTHPRMSILCPKCFMKLQER